MRLILVRHPKPNCDSGLCYGRLDLECDGHALATAAGRLKPLMRGCQIVTSPARRAQSLAQLLGAPIAVEPRLEELHFGDWEGLRWEDIGREQIEAWRQSLPDAAPPGGETLSAMARRCADWLGSLNPDGPPVAAITHAGPIRAIRALLKGEPLLTYFQRLVPFAEPLALEADRAILSRSISLKT